ncbi:MAG TPA: bacillithiol transferase BstA [Rhodothermales bacterium]|nr:bacillithiol transferase BstA [Rhodothermales bacterium]
MADSAPDDLRYPIGRYVWPTSITPEMRAGWIFDLAAAPAALRDAVDGLDDARLDTPYRPGGWTVRQVVHHLPDSHLNAYVRFKLALTEEAPTIKPYDEALWAELPDTTGPVAPSLHLLDGLHARWTDLLRALPEEAWARTFVHPEHGRSLRLDSVLGMYAWHGRHHVAHIIGAAGGRP